MMHINYGNVVMYVVMYAVILSLYYACNITGRRCARFEHQQHLEKRGMCNRS